VRSALGNGRVPAGRHARAAGRRGLGADARIALIERHAVACRERRAWRVDTLRAVVQANGIDIAYERSGSGPRLLFFNGSGSTLRSSAPLISLFTSRFDVIAHDQRGLGDTSIPPGPYEMSDYAADAAALLDTVGWDSCRVVGVSFGGMVAQEFAVTWPDRVERLALCCTSPGGAGGSSYPLHDLDALPLDERARRGAQLLDTRFTPEWLATHEGDRALFDMMAARALAEKTDEQRRGEREQLDARRRHDVTDRLHRITAPTLVACGRHDGIAPPSNAEAIASRISGAELRCYEGGHAFFAQDPSAMPDILDFLAGS
jgi:pimeloyl-ACP methyl ester carboxylesterase